MLPIMQLTSALATSFEFVLIVALLAFFAPAYPDLYCKALWGGSGSKEWHSEPSFHLYSCRNHLEITSMRWILDEWSMRYNLCVAIITMVLWVVRLCIRGHTLDIYSTVVSNVLYDIILIALWSYSAVIQSPGQYLDLECLYPQRRDLCYRCNEALPQGLSTCETTRASSGLAIFPLVWFGTRCLLTCIYGAYTYGRNIRDMEFLRYNEKVFG